MNAEDIMRLSLKLAGLQEVPEDSATYVSGKEVKKALFGIDAGVPELLLAKQLGCDCVIAHHPIGGTAAINFAQAFRRHIQQMVDAGIPRKEAEKAVAKKLEQLEVDAHTRNYSHAIDVGGLLKMSYMNIHTPLDEIGRRIMTEQIRSKTNKNSTVQDVVSALNRLGEFKNAITKIKILVGKPENPAGKVVVSHGAGTNGGYEIAKAYFQHGIGTVIYIHVNPADVEKLRAENKGNLIVTGHIASDSLGINPFLRALEKEGVSVTTIGVIPDSEKDSA
jgi:putative NIF3 family GTP cyclohydrolase 1 type 2